MDINRLTGSVRLDIGYLKEISEYLEKDILMEKEEIHFSGTVTCLNKKMSSQRKVTIDYNNPDSNMLFDISFCLISSIIRKEFKQNIDQPISENYAFNFFFIKYGSSKNILDIMAKGDIKDYILKSNSKNEKVIITDRFIDRLKELANLNPNDLYLEWRNL